MRYRGSCHCGAVQFEADLDLTQPSYRCNCSICKRTRFWPAIARPEQFEITQGEDQLTEYLFNKKKNQHFFCKQCGVRPFGIGNDTPIGQMIGVNIGCLEGLTEEQLEEIPITYVDNQNDSTDPPKHTAHL